MYSWSKQFFSYFADSNPSVSLSYFLKAKLQHKYIRQLEALFWAKSCKCMQGCTGKLEEELSLPQIYQISTNKNRLFFEVIELNTVNKLISVKKVKINQALPLKYWFHPFLFFQLLKPPLSSKDLVFLSLSATESYISAFLSTIEARYSSQISYPNNSYIFKANNLIFYRILSTIFQVGSFTFLIPDHFIDFPVYINILLSLVSLINLSLATSERWLFRAKEPVRTYLDRIVEFCTLFQPEIFRDCEVKSVNFFLGLACLNSDYCFISIIIKIISQLLTKISSSLTFYNQPKILQNFFRQICYLLGNQQKYKMIKLKNGKNNPQTNHQSHYIVSPLKVANFNLNIKYPAYTARRYSQQQKIMSRRQMVSSPFSLHKEDQIFKGYNRFAAQQVKESPETQEKAEIKSSSPDIDNFSPFLKDKLMEIRTFLYRNTHSTKPNQQHHINFSQLAILQQQPKPPSVLHMRMRKECPLARASQMRVAINTVKSMRRSNTSSDAFKSIEVNNNSKYGCTTKIGFSEGKVKNSHMSQLKKKLEKRLVQRSFTQRRKTSRSSTFGANRKERYQNEYQPWQIKKGEQGEQEHFQLQC